MPKYLYRYTGDDAIAEHTPGIPARSLTQGDYDALDKEQRAALRHSPLYAKVEPKPEPPKADEKPASRAKAAPVTAAAPIAAVFTPEPPVREESRATAPDTPDTPKAP